MKTEKKLNKFYILGVKIGAITINDLVDIVSNWIKNNYKDYIVLTGAHGIIEMQSNDELRKINNSAGLVTPDGMPEVWIGRMKGFKNIEKVYAPRIMHAIFQDGIDKNYKHYFYGGKEGVAEKLTKEMKKMYPGIQIVGNYCPPFRSLTDIEVKKISAQINETQANIVWCGLGCPKQEMWMNQFRPLLNANVLIGVGAGFDFLSGTKPLAPDWIVDSGFEWFYRLLTEPSRLWKRYSSVVPKFIYLNILEALGLYKVSNEK